MDARAARQFRLISYQVPGLCLFVLLFVASPPRRDQIGYQKEAGRPKAEQRQRDPPQGAHASPPPNLRLRLQRVDPTVTSGLHGIMGIISMVLTIRSRWHAASNSSRCRTPTTTSRSFQSRAEAAEWQAAMEALGSWSWSLADRRCSRGGAPSRKFASYALKLEYGLEAPAMGTGSAINCGVASAAS
jgi:hypothetical protein